MLCETARGYRPDNESQAQDRDGVEEELKPRVVGHDDGGDKPDQPLEHYGDHGWPQLERLLPSRPVGRFGTAVPESA